MLKVYTEKWKQTLDDLLRLSREGKNPRTSERFSALYQIARGDCAATVASRLGRNEKTPREWVHIYNSNGPDALRYTHTGGRRSSISEEISQAVDELLSYRPLVLSGGSQSNQSHEGAPPAEDSPVATEQEESKSSVNSHAKGSLVATPSSVDPSAKKN